MMKIVIIVCGLIVLTLFIFATRVPVSLTSEEVSRSVTDAIAESNLSVDEDIVEKAVLQSVEVLEKRQSSRLKYLASAYIVVWLVFMLYVIRVVLQQRKIRPTSLTIRTRYYTKQRRSKVIIPSIFSFHYHKHRKN